MVKRIFLVIVFSLLLSFCGMHAGWFPQNSGTNSLLMDVFFTDPHTGWIVGITNTILHTTDGGANWIAQSPPPSVNYYSVCFIDSLTGCAVGADVGGGPRIRHTTDGGDNWDIITPPGDAYSLWSIDFINENNGWIAGGRERGFNIDPIRTIHYSTNGGTSWSSQLYQYDSLPLHEVHFADAHNGCAVGDHGAIFWTTDGGTNWIQRPSPTFKNLWGVYLIDDSTAWASGVQGTVLHTIDAGNSWTPANVDSTGGFGKIIFTDDLNGWIVGSASDSVIVLHTDNGGNTWDYQYTGTVHGLISVYFTDPDTGWVVGNIGTILHTTDGGATGVAETDDRVPGKTTWELTSHPNPFFTTTTITLHTESRNRSACATASQNEGGFGGFSIGGTEIKIFDVLGRTVRTLSCPMPHAPGAVHIKWDGKDKTGNIVSPGIYFIAISGHIEKKIVKIK